MKKLALTIAAVAGASLVGYSQGTVYVNNDSANGYVVTSAYSDTSSAVDATYANAANFSVQLFMLTGNVQSTSGLTGLDAYSFLNPNDLTLNNFVAGTAVGSGSAGVFSIGNATTTPNTGSDSLTTGPGISTVVALVAWTGAYATYSAALTAWNAHTAGVDIGILAFEQALAPGGTDPTVADLSLGWDTIANSPNAAANGGNQDLILTANSVPEPGTLALAGLGGFGMLMALRRKKA